MDKKPRNTNYSIRYDNDNVIIDRKRSQRDWGHFLYYFILGTALVGFPSYLFYKSKHFNWTTNTILTTCFFALIMLWGLTRIIIALEILSVPTKAFIIIDKSAKVLKAKLTFLRKTSFPFEDLKEIQLSGHDTIVESQVETVTYKRRLYYHQLQFLTRSNKIKKIHRFLYPKLLIPVLSKEETFDVSTNAKQISKFISSETGVKYKWLGTKNKDE